MCGFVWCSDCPETNHLTNRRTYITLTNTAGTWNISTGMGDGQIIFSIQIIFWLENVKKDLNGDNHHSFAHLNPAGLSRRSLVCWR